MNPTSSLFDLDPTIPSDLAEAARSDDAPGIDYDTVFAQIAARFAQDDLEGLGGGTITPATPPEAIVNAHTLHEHDVNVGVGFCLKVVRTDFLVPALWPDAETQWDNGGALGKTRHAETDPLKFPRGSVGYCTNGRHGHVFLCVGGGLCWTTDFRRPGFVDLALIKNMAPWVGGQLVGWAEILEGFDVWPNPHHAKPTPPFGLIDREHQVHLDLLRVRKNHPHDSRRIAGLERWDERLLARLDAANDKPLR